MLPYGSSITKDIMRTTTAVWTEHRPLIGTISNFSFDSPMTPRLKRFISMIKIYAVELQYIKFQLLADMLIQLSSLKRGVLTNNNNMFYSEEYIHLHVDSIVLVRPIINVRQFVMMILLPYNSRRLRWTRHRFNINRYLLNGLRCDYALPTVGRPLLPSLHSGHLHSSSLRFGRLRASQNTNSMNRSQDHSVRKTGPLQHAKHAKSHFACVNPPATQPILAFTNILILHFKSSEVEKV